MVKPVGFTLNVRVDGVTVLVALTVSQEPFKIDVEILTGELEVTLTDCEPGFALPRAYVKLRLAGVTVMVGGVEITNVTAMFCGLSVAPAAVTITVPV